MMNGGQMEKATQGYHAALGPLKFFPCQITSSSYRHTMLPPQSTYVQFYALSSKSLLIKMQLNYFLIHENL